MHCPLSTCTASQSCQCHPSNVSHTNVNSTYYEKFNTPLIIDSYRNCCTTFLRLNQFCTNNSLIKCASQRIDTTNACMYVFNWATFIIIFKKNINWRAINIIYICTESDQDRYETNFKIHPHLKRNQFIIKFLMEINEIVWVWFYSIFLWILFEFYHFFVFLLRISRLYCIWTVRTRVLNEMKTENFL